jgi:colanic acid/amylovoran biosynthesis glycosyltransferase
VYEHMDTSDIFCVPSRREALGVANIEALNSGISVITTNVGGVPEVMDYGRNGWLVNPEAPHELAAAIQECIEDCVKRQALSSNGLTFIRKFSKENMIDNFIRLLTEKITC